MVSHEEKVPIERVLADMYDPDGGLISNAARDYYYLHYATPEEQVRMDKEEKFQTRFTSLITIGAFLFPIIFVICQYI